MTKSVLAASLALFALLAPARDEESASLYPPERSETRVHFYALNGEPDMAKLRNALDTLGEGTEIVFGPETSRSLPQNFFVVVQAPAGVEAKQITKALKKGKTKPELLQWMLTSFQTPDFRALAGGGGGGGGRSGGAGGGGGGPEAIVRRLVLAQHGDLRWFEMASGHAIFFWSGNKLNGKELMDRLHKALAPALPAESLPAVVRDEFTWSLAAGFKPGNLRKAERELSKLGGVAEVVTDEELGTLTLRVDLADQLASTEPGPWPAPPEEATGERGRGGPDPGSPDPGGEDPGGEDPGGEDPGGGRGGAGDAGTGDWFDAHRLVFDRNLVLDVLDRTKLHVADPAEGTDE